MSRPTPVKPTAPPSAAQESQLRVNSRNHILPTYSVMEPIGLRTDKFSGRSRSRTGGLLHIREALYHLSYPPNGRGWARTSSLLFVRQALSRLSYSPLRQIRDKGSNLDLHVQSVASCRLDDPGAQ